MSLYKIVGDYTDAESLLLLALEIRYRTPGEESADFVISPVPTPPASLFAVSHSQRRSGRTAIPRAPRPPWQMSIARASCT
jgi:hypothetical protein